jgi:hypothetical protein
LHHYCGTGGTGEHGLVKWLATPFTYPALGAILVQFIAKLGRSVAITAKQRHIGDMNRCFKFNDTNLGACTTGGPLMLPHDIDARNNHAVLVRIPAYSAMPAIHLPTTDDPVDSAFCPTLFTAQDYDGITLSYFHRYLLAHNPARQSPITPQPNNDQR